MSSYRIDSDRTLRDGQGNAIGKVGYNNEVRDGWRDRGAVSSQDRYVDEYGRDRGWAVRGGSSGDGGAGAALGPIFLLFWGIFALISWISDRLQARAKRAHAVPRSSPSPDIHAPSPKAEPLFTFEPLDLGFLSGEQGTADQRSPQQGYGTRV